MISIFKDKEGKWSMMRVLSFMVVAACLPFIYLHPEQSPTISVLIGGAIAGKWLQKKGE